MCGLSCLKKSICNVTWFTKGVGLQSSNVCVEHLEELRDRLNPFLQLNEGYLIVDDLPNVKINRILPEGVDIEALYREIEAEIELLKKDYEKMLTEAIDTNFKKLFGG